MWVLAPCLRTLDGVTFPPVCMSHLETSPPTPQQSFTKFGNPKTALENTSFSRSNIAATTAAMLTICGYSHRLCWNICSDKPCGNESSGKAFQNTMCTCSKLNPQILNIFYRVAMPHSIWRVGWGMKVLRQYLPKAKVVSAQATRDLGLILELLLSPPHHLQTF